MGFTDFLEQSAQTVSGGGKYITVSQYPDGTKWAGLLTRAPFERPQKFGDEPAKTDKDGNVKYELVFDFLPIGGDPETDELRMVVKDWTATQFALAWKEVGSPILKVGDYIEWVHNSKRVKNKTNAATHFEFKSIKIEPRDAVAPTTVTDKPIDAEKAARAKARADAQAALAALEDDDEIPF